ncbi:MAG: MBL fold metallo-hydrolase [Chloroflexi bacterium]|nr:MBL fold metallo-hydrolase [Chloroflexota bacterium]
MGMVWTRQMGEARLAVIDEGHGWWPVERALDGVPESEWRPVVRVDDRDRMFIGFNLVHITLPGASILLDTGLGEYGVSDPNKPQVVGGITLTAGLEAGLAELGSGLEDITHVLITHMHGDHIVGATKTIDGRRVPMFPKARYYVMAEEWRNSPAPNTMLREVIPAQMEALAVAGVVELLEGETEIVPGVTMIPAPGESKGHAIIRLTTPDGTVFYVGDLFHQPAEFEHLDWIPRYRDRELLVGTRRRLMPQLAAPNTWIIVAHHEFPAIGRAEPAGESYRWIPMPLS